jgi:ribosomal protein S27E
MLCKKRRIKPTQKHTSMGMTTIEHISEGMCRQCAWERIKHKCKICGEVIGKGYPKLLAHITSHYTSNELLYNEDRDIDIISINFEKAKTSNKWLVVDEDEKGQHHLKCKICGDTFMFKKGETIFSKWIEHIKSHYIDKHLLEKVWVAKIIFLTMYGLFL